MSALVISWDQLNESLDRPLPANATMICCGLRGTVGEVLTGTRPFLSWSSDLEPRLLQGLPFAAAWLGTPESCLIACGFPRPDGAQTLSDCLRIVATDTAWETQVVPGESRRSALAPNDSAPLSPYRTRLLQNLGDAAADATRPERIALEAGVRQLADDLDGSHAGSQSIEGVGDHRDGDYWHAIMHRREPDYGNSCYWFRRVGQHPIFPSLADEWLDIVQETGAFPELTATARAGRWAPATFVRACEATTGQSSGERELLEQFQYRELLLLFKWTYLATFSK